jgi:PAS domain S-box-containing protein
MDDARQNNGAAASLLGHTAFRDTLRRAVLWPVATLVVALALLLALLVYLFHTARLADHSNAVLTQISRVEKLVVDMETGVRGYGITGDTAFLEPFQQASTTLFRDLDTLEKLVKDDSRQLAQAQALRKSHAVWSEFATNVRQRVQARLPANVADHFRGKELMDNVRSHISAIQQYERGLLAQRAPTRGRLRIAALTSVALFPVLLAPMLFLSVRRALVRLDGSYESALGSLDRERTRLDAALSTMVTDIRERKRTEILLDCQKRSLEMVVSGAPLCDVLTYLALVVEEQSEGKAIASILLLGADGLLRNGASPTLPADYLKAIDGLKPCAEVGTCCAAAATGKVILTPNIETDPRWQTLKHLPLNLGFVAAWSQPITASDGRVLGTFGTYFRETREPTPFERQTVEMLARAAALAIERHHSEEALRASEERFRAFVTTSSDVVYRMSPDWSEMRELKGKDFIADTEANRGWLAQYIHPEDQPGVLAAVEQSIKTRSPFQLEHRVLRLDGSVGWTFSRAIPLRNPEGNIIEWFGAATDITDRRRVEDDRKRFVSLAENSSDFIGICGPDFLPFFVNRAGLAMVGLNDLDHARRTPVKEFFFPEDQDGIVNEFFPDVLAQGSRQVEIRFRHFKTGEALWMLYNVWVVNDDQGKFAGLATLSRDITERKRAEEALRASEERYRSLFDSIDEGFCVIEMIFDSSQKPVDYRFIEVNPAFERQAGMHGATGKRMLEFVSEIEPHWLENYGRVALTGKPIRFADEYKSLGSWFDVYAFRVAHPESRRVAVLFNNITQRKEAEAAVLRSRSALAAANEELALRARQLDQTIEKRTAELRDTIQQLETFSYSIVHDLRAPLRSMRSFAGFLQQRYTEKLDPPGRDYVRRIMNSAARMDALITDVLSYSQVSRAVADLDPVDLDQLVPNVIEQYPNLHEVADAIHLERPLPKVFGNTALLTQVFSNLLGNALKFVPEGRAPQVKVRTETNHKFVRVWVEDNGIGVPPEHRERIFGLFQRLQRPEQYAGTGVGLAIVKRAVERLGGATGVDSANGDGSRFWIDLPLAIPTPQLEAARPTARSTTGREARPGPVTA